MKTKLSTTLPEFLYLLFFSFMLFSKAIGLDDGQPLYNILLAVSLVAFTFKLLITRYTFFDFIWITVILALSIITYKLSGERGILFLTATIVGFKDSNIKHVLKLGAFIWTFCFIIMAFLTQTGLMNDLFLVHNKGSLGYIVRWSFGYTHPNVLHISFIVLLALIFCSSNLNLKQLILASAIAMLANLYVFIYSVSYTGFILATSYLVINCIFTWRESLATDQSFLWKLFDILVEIIFPFCIFFSILGPILFTGKLYELCDKLVHHRFVLSNFYLTTERLSILGHRLEFTPDSNRSIDCSYVYLLVHCGIVIFALFCLVYIFFIHNCIRNHKYKELSVTIILIVAGITEPFLFNTSYKNISVIFIAEYLFDLSSNFLSHECLPKVLKIDFSLKSFYQKQIRISFIGNIYNRTLLSINQFLSSFKSHAAKIILKSFAVGILAVIIYSAIGIKPNSVLIPASCCPDGYLGTAQKYTQEQIDSSDMKNVRVLSYNPNVEMVMFNGVTATIEYFRIIISVFVWSSTISILIICIISTVKTNKQISLKGKL